MGLMVSCKLEHRYKDLPKSSLRKEGISKYGILTKCLKFGDAVLFILTEKNMALFKENT